MCNLQPKDEGLISPADVNLSFVANNIQEEQEQGQQETFKKPQEGPEKPQPTDVKAAINFMVRNNNVDINFLLSDHSEDAAKYLALLLHQLNGGTLESQCIEILRHTGLTHPDQTVFINKCFEYWQQYRDEDNQQNDEPLIKPSEVFRNFTTGNVK